MRRLAGVLVLGAAAFVGCSRLNEGIRPCVGSEACFCEADNDCRAEPGGRCEIGGADGYGYDPGVVQRCVYPECRTDEDCARGTCEQPDVSHRVRHCEVVTCRGDEECVRGDGLTGHCSTLAFYGEQETHCIYPDDVCDGVLGGSRPCPDDPSGSADRASSCVFRDGKPTCIFHETPYMPA